MKEGRTLVELAQELTRQQATKKDYIADTRQLEIVPEVDDGKVCGPYQLKVNGHGHFDMTEHTHDQLAQRIGIPKKYYDRMRTESPALLKRNVEHWFQNEPKRQMVRTLDGMARAFLSDRYRPLDNMDLAEAVLPVLTDAKDIQIVSTEITATRMYIKALFPKIQGEVKRGDLVQSGIVITNSEIGLSAVRIEPLIFRLVCTNGMIAPDFGTRKYHVGRNVDGGENAHELYRDETMKADDRAFWMKVQDTVRGSLEQAKFDKILESLRKAAETDPIQNPLKAVEVITEKFQLNQSEQSSFLTHLLKDGDLTKWGVINAFTRTSQDIQDYDRATDFERLGGNVLVLPARDWKEIAEAA